MFIFALSWIPFEKKKKIQHKSKLFQARIFSSFGKTANFAKPVCTNACCINSKLALDRLPLFLLMQQTVIAITSTQIHFTENFHDHRHKIYRHLLGLISETSSPLKYDN